MAKSEIVSKLERSLLPAKSESEDTVQAMAIPSDTVMTEAPSPSKRRKESLSNTQGKGGSPGGLKDRPVLKISDLDRLNKDATDQSAPASKSEVDQTSISAARNVEETPATAGLNKMDFDTIFPDGAGEDGAGDLNFDLDFTTDTAGEQNMLGEDFALAGNIQSTAPPITGLPADNDDFSSLLPDLEEYGTLNDSDLSMLDMPIGATSTVEASQSQAAKSETGLLGDAGGSHDLLQSDSNLDNLFMDSTDFDIGTGNGTGTLGEGGEFDDAFFGLGDT